MPRRSITLQQAIPAVAAEDRLRLPRLVAATTALSLAAALLQLAAWVLA